MLSRHARERCAQRGLSAHFIDTILNYADIQRPIGGNCRLERVTRRRAQALNLDDRLSRYAIILSDTTAEIVTILPLHRSNRYTRRYA